MVGQQGWAQQARDWTAAARHKAGTAWVAAKARWWVQPLIIGTLALALGVALGFLLRGHPTASAEYQALSERFDETSGELGTLEHRVDNQADTVADLREDRDDLRGEVTVLDDREEGLDDREEELSEREEGLDDREEELSEREDAVTQTEDRIAENTFSGDGTYTVGEDIQPGTYRSQGSDCYWARLSSTSGDFDSIITNSFSSGPQVVTIQASDAAFETSGCGEWTKSE